MKWVAAALAAFLAIGGTLLGAAVASGEPAPVSAVSSIADCLQQRGHLLVEVLIDQSGSLQQTDPGNQRVSAVKVAIGGLQRLVAGNSGSSNRTIEVQLAGFDVNYQTVTPWTPLNQTTSQALQQQADIYAGRNTGFETDYAAAFLGAQVSLAQRTAQLTKDGSPQPCSTILWFTDGKDEIDVRGNSAQRNAYGVTKSYAPQFDLTQRSGVEDATFFGRAILCKSGGVIDQLRSSGTSILAFLLTTEVAPNDADFLKAIATGQSNAISCGHAGSRSSGAAYEAADAVQVLGDFDDVTATVNGGSPIGSEQDTPLCPRIACAAGVRRFTIDPGLRSFHLLVVTGSKQIVVELLPPGATAPVVIQAPNAKTDRVGPTTLISQWPAANAVVVDATRGSSDRMWVGQWRVTFIDPTGSNLGAVARSQIHIYGDLVPALQPLPKFVLGQTSTVSVTALHGDGTPATDLGTFRDATVTAEIVEPGGGVTNAIALRRTGDEFLGTYRVDRSIRSTQVNLTLQLNLVTKSGIALAPVVRTFPIDVRPPETYPTLSPSTLRFGSITGSHGSSTTVDVTGGSGAGCVWFEPAQVQSLPTGVSQATITVTPPATSEKSCLRVNAGERRQIQLTVKPTGDGNGSLNARITARLEAEGNDQKIPQDFQLSVSMQRPINNARRLGIFLTLLIPGLLLPFVIVWLLKWFTARFEGVRDMRLAVIPVTVADRKVIRHGAEAPETPLLGPDDLNTVELSGSDRHPVLGDLHLDTHVGLNPFRPPFGLMVNAAGPVLHHRYDRDADHLPLALGDTWLCALTGADHSDTGLTVEGTLYVLIAGQGDARSRLADIEREVRRELPSLSVIAAGRMLPPASAPEGDIDGDAFESDDKPPNSPPSMMQPPGPRDDNGPPPTRIGAPEGFDEPPPSNFRT